MSLRLYLKYGDEYESMRHWDLFMRIISGSRGRRNFLIYRVFTALIDELGIKDRDEYRMINEIERWANDHIRDPADENRKPQTVTESFMQEPATGKSDTGSVAAFDSKVSDEKHHSTERPESQNSGSGFDSSIFSGMSKTSF